MSNKSALTQRFGLWTGIYVVFANMIGSGILTVPGPAWKELGSPQLLIGLWILGGFLALAGALTLSQMASSYSEAGGDYGLVRLAFGNRTGFVYGQSMILLGFAAPIALIAFTAINYLYPFLSSFTEPIKLALHFGDHQMIQLLATLLILGFAFGHSQSHAQSSVLQSLTTLFKVGCLVALGILLIVIAPEMPTPTKVSDSPFSVGKIGLTLTQIMYAYTGWNGAVYLSAETKNSHTLIPKAILWGTILVMGFYVFMNVAFVLSVPFDALFSAGPERLGRISELAISLYLSPGQTQGISTVIGLGVLASVSSYLLTGPRVCYAMAVDDFLPNKVATTRKDTEIPHVAVYLLALLSIGFLWSGTFEQVLEFTSFGIAVFANLLILPIFKLRKRADYRPKLNGPIYAVAPYIFLMINNLMLAAAFFEAPKMAILSTLTVLTGYPIYSLIMHFRSQKVD